MWAAMEALALTVQCPRCHRYGWCMTQSGQRANTLHARRTDALRTAYAMGYMDHAAETTSLIVRAG